VLLALCGNTVIGCVMAVRVAEHTVDVSIVVTEAQRDGATKTVHGLVKAAR
jgi:hypothetical protein